MIITLSGTFGSGGLEIARALSQQLGYMLFEKEIVERAAEIAGEELKTSTGMVYDEDMDQLDEEKSYSKVLLKLQFDTLPQYVSSNYEMEKNTLKRIKQAEANKKAVMEAVEASKNGNCIFVGRCAGYFLRDDPRAVRIFTMDNCLSNVKNRVRSMYPDISDADMVKLITVTNKRRKDYLEYLTQQDMMDMNNYDFVFNTGYINDEETIELIKEIVNHREQILNA